MVGSKGLLTCSPEQRVAIKWVNLTLNKLQKLILLTILNMYVKICFGGVFGILFWFSEMIHSTIIGYTGTIDLFSAHLIGFYTQESLFCSGKMHWACSMKKILVAKSPQLIPYKHWSSSQQLVSYPKISAIWPPGTSVLTPSLDLCRISLCHFKAPLAGDLPRFTLIQ